ncbi:HNH endonuclease [Streptomyces sp. NPDC091412]|uniref:HNH endonuclease n=1 Tax=Streptomyces sp. NPDC091412 TaxID=3366002 RepID=UPI003830D64D
MSVPARLRFEVLRRDGFRCRYCGVTAADAELTVDHVTPIALGGADALDNLVTACGPCNNGKTSTAPDDVVMAALEATKPLVTTGFQRTVWGLLAENSATDLHQPYDPAADPFWQQQVFGGWAYGWIGDYPDADPEPAEAERSAARKSVEEIVHLGYSPPLLWAAAVRTGAQKSTDLAPVALALHEAVMAELKRFREQQAA